MHKETGFEIGFESALVPRWRAGTLRLQNVSIQCDANSWISRKKQEWINAGNALDELPHIDTNWAFWDLKVQSIDVTLSLWRWLDGKGLIKECTVKGVRGTIDRTHIEWPHDWKPFRRLPAFGDFEILNFVVEDLLVTLKNPGQRPYKISIFHGQAPLLRKQWLLYDLCCANSIVGVFDDSLFSVHRPQRSDWVFEEASKGPWAKMVFCEILNSLFRVT